jgi:hypothetical protein
MTTIDILLSEMDRVKTKYDRQSVLNFFFEFASEFMDYTGMPKTQENYTRVMGWKMYGLARHLYKNYDKHTKMTEQIVRMPSYSTIPACLEQEVENWNKYQKKLQETHS